MKTNSSVVRYIAIIILLAGFAACAKKHPEGLRIPEKPPETPVDDPNELNPSIRVLFPIPNSNLGLNEDASTQIKVKVVGNESATSVSVASVFDEEVFSSTIELGKGDQNIWNGTVPIKKGSDLLKVEVITTSGNTIQSIQSIANDNRPFAGSVDQRYNSSSIDLDEFGLNLFFSDPGQAAVVRLDLFNGNRIPVYQRDSVPLFAIDKRWPLGYSSKDQSIYVLEDVDENNEVTNQIIKIPLASDEAQIASKKIRSPELISPKSAKLNTKDGVVYILDAEQETSPVIGVNINNGLVFNPRIGDSNDFTKIGKEYDMKSAIVDEKNDRLFVLKGITQLGLGNNNSGAVLSISLKNGFLALVTSFDTLETGLVNISSFAYSEKDNSLYLSGESKIWKFSLASKEFSLISEFGNKGNGIKLDNSIVSLAVDEIHNIIYASDERKIFAVSIETGDRNLVSGIFPLLETEVKTTGADSPIYTGSTSSSTSSSSSSTSSSSTSSSSSSSSSTSSSGMVTPSKIDYIFPKNNSNIGQAAITSIPILLRVAADPVNGAVQKVTVNNMEMARSNTDYPNLWIIDNIQAIVGMSTVNIGIQYENGMSDVGQLTLHNDKSNKAGLGDNIKNIKSLTLDNNNRILYFTNPLSQYVGKYEFIDSAKSILQVESHNGDSINGVTTKSNWPIGFDDVNSLIYLVEDRVNETGDVMSSVGTTKEKNIKLVTINPGTMTRTVVIDNLANGDLERLSSARSLYYDSTNRLEYIERGTTPAAIGKYLHILDPKTQGTVLKIGILESEPFIDIYRRGSVGVDAEIDSRFGIKAFVPDYTNKRLLIARQFEKTLFASEVGVGLGSIIEVDNLGVKTLVKKFESGPTLINNPSALALGRDSKYLYIADNGRIWKMDMDSTDKIITLLSSSNPVGGLAGSGPGISSDVISMVVDPDNPVLYLANGLNGVMAISLLDGSRVTIAK